MRIISGCHKGIKLQTFRGRAVRPTPDRVREALFSILASKTPQATVLDLFAGTGALGIEAVSRGARSAMFIDNNSDALKILQNNIEKCRLTDTTQVILWDISRNLDCLRTQPHAFSLILMDPPYGCNLAAPTLKHLWQTNCLADEATIVVEHEPGLAWEDLNQSMRMTDSRRYGKTQLTFFEWQPERNSDSESPAHREQKNV